MARVSSGVKQKTHAATQAGGMGCKFWSRTLLTGAGICVRLPIGSFRSSYFQLVTQDAGVRQEPVPQDDVCLELVKQPLDACTQAGSFVDCDFMHCSLQ